MSCKSAKWSRVLPCGQKDERTGMRKQKAVFRNFANGSNNKIGNVRNTIIVARSRNHCSNGNITMCFVCIFELHDIINNIKILNASKKCFYGKFVTSNNKTYVILHINWLTFFVRFSTNVEFPSRFCWKPPNAKVYGNPSSGSRADTCGQTDGHNEDIRRLSRLFERA